jgi:hypothetical protein
MYLAGEITYLLECDKELEKFKSRDSEAWAKALEEMS